MFAISSDREALRIYRRDPIRGPGQGVFFRAIAFKELWPPEKIKTHSGGTDGSPAWFVGSSFDFSANNRELTYRFDQTASLRIDLTNGTLSKQ